MGEPFRRSRNTLTAIRIWSARTANRRWLLLVAVALFVVLAVGAFRALPDDTELRPWFMAAIALVGAPALWVVNALEYRAIGAAAGHRIGFESAFRVSFTASVANLLPAPGGVAVRTAALKLAGSTLRTAVGVNVIAGVIWIGATGVLVGATVLAAGIATLTGAVALTSGLALIAVSAVALRRRLTSWRLPFVQLLLIETVSTLVAAVLVALSFAAIGQNISVAAALTIASSSVLAAAIGIFPAGFGIREAFAGALALLVDVPAATAISASVVERGVTIAAMGIFALLIGVRLGRSETPAPIDGETIDPPGKD